ncbi:zwei Ig domain protein zig-8 [Rhipicephalus sanguineus]|nr:zwei Ig domain protein zig-8 [Rhipicephalus sanguineus]
MSPLTLFANAAAGGTRSAHGIAQTVGLWATLSSLAVLTFMVLTLAAIDEDGPAQSRRSHPDASAPSPENPGSVVSRAASRRVRSAEASLVSAPEILNPKLFPDIEQPAFDNSTPRNVTTQQMQTVYLHCIVNNLGERTVSWIRRRDFHVLTVGLTTYTADDRFQAVHMDRSEDWMLQIKRVQPTDAGDYECQINMHPLISYFVRLTVLVPRARILEAPELFINSGSSINVSCAIEHSPEPPVFVFWYHNDRVINYDETKGGPGHISGAKRPPDAYVSSLFIRNARPQDSGNYTCGPSNADSTSVVVHVLNGEKRAAMQHDFSPSRALLPVSVELRLVFCSLFTTLGVAFRLTSS